MRAHTHPRTPHLPPPSPAQNRHAHVRARGTHAHAHRGDRRPNACPLLLSTSTGGGGGGCTCHVVDEVDQAHDLQLVLLGPHPPVQPLAQVEHQVVHIPLHQRARSSSAAFQRTFQLAFRALDQMVDGCQQTPLKSRYHSRKQNISHTRRKRSQINAALSVFLLRAKTTARSGHQPHAESRSSRPQWWRGTYVRSQLTRIRWSQ